jgi:hypothetical protein
MKIVNKRKFFDVVSTALVLDDDRDLLYYQNGCFRQLYQIDTKTFEVRRTFSGEGHARCLRLDPRRNCIYVLGYFSGTVFPVDLDTGKRPWTVRVGGLPHGMDLQQDTLWVNSMFGVLQLDLETIWRRSGHE